METAHAADAPSKADVAIRPVKPKEGDLWGRKLANITYCLYGARSYLAERGVPSADGGDLERHAMIGWDESARRFSGADWVEDAVPRSSIVYRTASLVNQLAAAKAGIGLAVLPSYMGDIEPDLARALPGAIDELSDELWIITHIALKDTARLRLFFDVFGESFARERELVEGSRPYLSQS